MPIVVVFEFPGEDIAKYHKVFELGGPDVLAQPERSCHLCWETENGFTVIDVWDDESSFEAFGPIIGPALAGAGLDAKPVIYPLTGTISAEGVRGVY